MGHHHAGGQGTIRADEGRSLADEPHHPNGAEAHEELYEGREDAQPAFSDLARASETAAEEGVACD